MATRPKKIRRTARRRQKGGIRLFERCGDTMARPLLDEDAPGGGMPGAPSPGHEERPCSARRADPLLFSTAAELLVERNGEDHDRAEDQPLDLGAVDPRGREEASPLNDDLRQQEPEHGA